MPAGTSRVRHDVGDDHAAVVLQHAPHLAQDARLVGRQVDDAVRRDDVRRAVLDRNLLEEPAAELHDVEAERGRDLRLALARDRQHLVGHVDADGAPLGPDLARRDEHVDAGARPEIDHRLAGLRRGGRHGAAAAVEALDDLRRNVRQIGSGSGRTGQHSSACGCSAACP
jgi:hypothetical protein